MSASLGDDAEDDDLGDASDARDRSERRGQGDPGGDPSDAPTVSPPTVLIADGPSRAERYGSWIDDVFPTATASTPSAAVDAVTRDVGVAVLGAGVSDDTKGRLLEVLDVRSPFVRSIVVQGDGDPPMLDGAGYDVCLFTPLEEGDLREAVRRLARISTYERAVSVFFEYTTHAANRQVGRDEADLADDETYRRLQEGIERTRAALERIRASLDESDRRILMESIEADPVGGFPDGPATGGSRHPDECTDCGLAWGDDHGSGLGPGYEQLGAFVWKCARCGGVQQAASASHRWLARR